MSQDQDKSLHLATLLLDAITANTPDAWRSQNPDDQTLDCLAQLLDDTGDPVLLETLGSWRHESDSHIRETLFAYAVRAHNQGRPVPPLQGIRLAGTALDDLAIRRPKPGRDPLDLTGAVFAGASMRRAAFDQVILDQADFSGATLTQSYFHQCFMTVSSWHGADAAGAAWKDSGVTWEDLDGAHTPGVVVIPSTPAKPICRGRG